MLNEAQQRGHSMQMQVLESEALREQLGNWCVCRGCRVKGKDNLARITGAGVLIAGVDPAASAAGALHVLTHIELPPIDSAAAHDRPAVSVSA
jgi:hypothetical protein